MSNRTTGQFVKITEEMASFYERKNKDYGDAFSNEVKLSGWGYATGLLGNKVDRIRNLLLHTEQHPQIKESVEDTLIDLANYAVMTLMEVRAQRELQDWLDMKPCPGSEIKEG
jgi:hypothetical protein